MQIEVNKMRSVAELVSEEIGQHNVIMIVDNKKNLAEIDYISIITCAKDFLMLNFADISHPVGGYRLASKDQINKAIDWCKGKKSIIVCCGGGQARSPALAYVLKTYDCGDAREAMKVIGRNQYPTGHVIEIGAEVLNKPEMIDCLRCYRMHTGGSSHS